MFLCPKFSSHLTNYSSNFIFINLSLTHTYAIGFLKFIFLFSKSTIFSLFGCLYWYFFIPTCQMSTFPILLSHPFSFPAVWTPPSPELPLVLLTQEHFHCELKLLFKVHFLMTGGYIRKCYNMVLTLLGPYQGTLLPLSNYWYMF